MTLIGLVSSSNTSSRCIGTVYVLSMVNWEDGETRKSVLFFLRIMNTESTWVICTCFQLPYLFILEELVGSLW